MRLCQRTGRGPNGALEPRGQGLTSSPHPHGRGCCASPRRKHPAGLSSAPRLHQAHRGPGRPPAQGHRAPGAPDGVEVPPNVQNRAPRGPGSPSPAYVSEGTEIEETSVPAASFTVAETRTPATCPSVHEEAVVDTRTTGHSSATEGGGTEQSPSATPRTDLEACRSVTIVRERPWHLRRPRSWEQGRERWLPGAVGYREGGCQPKGTGFHPQDGTVPEVQSSYRRNAAARPWKLPGGIVAAAATATCTAREAERARTDRP